MHCDAGPVLRNTLGHRIPRNVKQTCRPANPDGHAPIHAHLIHRAPHQIRHARPPELDIQRVKRRRRRSDPRAAGALLRVPLRHGGADIGFVQEMERAGVGGCDGGSGADVRVRKGGIDGRDYGGGGGDRRVDDEVDAGVVAELTEFFFEPGERFCGKGVSDE